MKFVTVDQGPAFSLLSAWLAGQPASPFTSPTPSLRLVACAWAAMENSNGTRQGATRNRSRGHLSQRLGPVLLASSSWAASVPSIRRWHCRCPCQRTLDGRPPCFRSRRDDTVRAPVQPLPGLVSATLKRSALFRTVVRWANDKKTRRGQSRASQTKPASRGSRRTTPLHTTAARSRVAPLCAPAGRTPCPWWGAAAAL